MNFKAVFITILLIVPLFTNLRAQNIHTGKKSKNTVVRRADVKPSFIGGNNALSEYIDKNLEYPKSAKMKGIKGRVDVSFIVEKDGRLTHIQIERKLSRSHNGKAKKLIRNMPKWKPALIGGQPIRFRFHLPVTFKTDKTSNAK